MNLFHLKYFYEAALTQQISEAARKNHVSQSAVSQAIRALESELSCELTLHQRRSFELTAAGRALFDKCRQVFEAVDHLRAGIDQSKEPHRGQFVIGTTTSYAVAKAGALILKIRKEYPAMGIRLKIANSEVLRQWLTDKQIDLAIMVDDLKKDRRLKTDVIATGRYVMVKSRVVKTPFANAEVVVTRAQRGEVRLWLKRYAQTYRRKVKITQEILSWQVIRSLALAGIGYGLVPDYVVATDVKNKTLQPLKVKFESPGYRLVTLRRKSSESDSNLAIFIDTLARVHKLRSAKRPR